MAQLDHPSRARADILDAEDAIGMSLRLDGAGELQFDAVGVLPCLAQSSTVQYLLDGDWPAKMESLGELAPRIA